MSDTPDPLERELAALRPRGPSRRLWRGVDDALEGPRFGYRVGLFIVGVLTAAVVLLSLYRGGTDTSIKPVPPPAATPDDDSESAPTLQAYRRALTRSPEELDALLDRHAASARADERPIAAFTRSEVN